MLKEELKELKKTELKIETNVKCAKQFECGRFIIELEMVDKVEILKDTYILKYSKNRMMHINDELTKKKMRSTKQNYAGKQIEISEYVVRNNK